MSKSKHHKRFIQWIAAHSHAVLVRNSYATHVSLFTTRVDAQREADHVNSISITKCAIEVVTVEHYLRWNDPMDTYIITEVYAY